MSKGPTEKWADAVSMVLGISFFGGFPLAVLTGAVAGGLHVAGYDDWSKPIAGVSTFFAVIAVSAFVVIQFIDFDKLKKNVEDEKKERKKAEPKPA